ncbi:MAG: YARHG domain-containing protein [Eubacteriales bacterium]|nr:YARHG domain-containing protein [Eubacteriales bacterium]
MNAQDNGLNWPEEWKEKAKNRSKAIGKVYAALLAVCAALLLFSIVYKPTINLNEYISVQNDGYNGFASVRLNFNENRFCNDYEYELTSPNGSHNPQKFINDCIDYKNAYIDYNGGLKNGDTVKISLDQVRLAEREYAHKIKPDTIIYDVDGLEDAPTFDAFYGLDVTFEGRNGSGYAYLNTDGSLIFDQYLCYDLDKYDGLSNGDTVTLSTYYYEADSKKGILYSKADYEREILLESLKRNDKIPKELTKKFTVEGLEENGASSQSSAANAASGAASGSLAAGSNYSDGSIFPNSSNEIISESAIRALSDTDLRYAINEIFARHGYIFKDSGLQAHFSSFDWYKPTVNSDNFSDSVFNSVEKQNVAAMQKERDRRG